MKLLCWLERVLSWMFTTEPYDGHQWYWDTDFGDTVARRHCTRCGKVVEKRKP